MPMAITSGSSLKNWMQLPALRKTAIEAVPRRIVPKMSVKKKPWRTREYFFAPKLKPAIGWKP